MFNLGDGQNVRNLGKRTTRNGKYIGVIIKKPALSFENFKQIQYLMTSKWFLKYENPQRQANDQE